MPNPAPTRTLVRDPETIKAQIGGVMRAKLIGDGVLHRGAGFDAIPTELSGYEKTCLSDMVAIIEFFINSDLNCLPTEENNHQSSLEMRLKTSGYLLILSLTVLGFYLADLINSLHRLLSECPPHQLQPFITTNGESVGSYDELTPEALVERCAFSFYPGQHSNGLKPNTYLTETLGYGSVGAIFFAMIGLVCAAPLIYLRPSAASSFKIRLAARLSGFDLGAPDTKAYVKQVLNDWIETLKPERDCRVSCCPQTMFSAGRQTIGDGSLEQRLLEDGDQATNEDDSSNDEVSDAAAARV